MALLPDGAHLWGSCSSGQFRNSPGYSLTSAEFENILHVVQSGRPAAEPLGGADSALREGRTARSLMSQLHPFSLRGVNDRMVPHNVAAAHGRHPDFAFC